MRRNQVGTSMIVVIFMIVVCVFLVILGFKALPAVTEYFSIKKMIAQVVQEGSNLSVAEIKESFTRKATIEYTAAVKEDDLIISKEGNSVSISASYDKPIRLFGEDGGNHLDLVFHFEINEGKKPSSKDKSIE